MAYGDILDRLNDTRPVKSAAYNPFVTDGDHDMVVCSIEPFQNQEQNFCVRVTMLTEASNNPQVAQGQLFDEVWNLDKPSPFPGGERDKDRFAAFLNALQGVETTPTSHQALARACLKTRDEGGQLEMQPCRGARIKVSGRVKMPGPKSKPDAKPYVIRTYRHVPQTQETVVAMRQMLDQRIPYTYKAQQAPAAQPQQAAAPAQPAAAPAAAPASSGWSFPK